MTNVGTNCTRYLFTVTLPLQHFQVSGSDNLMLTSKDQDIECMKARDNQFHYLLVKVSIFRYAALSVGSMFISSI